MDSERFLEIANYVSKINMFPYFELSHCLLTCLYLKEEIGQGAHAFSRKHPLACYVSAMVSIYAGLLISSFLLGEPILACFTKTNSLLLATGSWYFINYLPFDLGYKVCKFLPIKLILSVMKEMLRCRKVFDGVTTAARIFPNGYVSMILIGVIKGNGTAFLKLFERLLRGVWTPSGFEIMNMSYPTKACVAASVIFVLDTKTDIFQTPHTLIQFGVLIFFIYFKLSSLLLGINDPFVPFENLLCSIFFGGLVDTVQRLLTPASKGDQTSVKTDASKNGKTDSAKKKE